MVASQWRAEADGDSNVQANNTAVPVSVQTAVRGEISHSLASTANLRARREVEVAARTGGIVVAVSAEEGDYVLSGQTLCSLDDSELRISLELAEQRLAQTKIQLESARIRREQRDTQIRNRQAELDRNEQALKEGLLAESEVAVERHNVEDLHHEVRVVESTVRENLARIEELESEIRRVRLQIAQTQIVAPFAGRVTERSVELGQSIRTAEKLFRLGTFSPLYADVHLAEDDSHLTRRGQPVRISLASGGEPAVGEVDRISPVVDTETGTVKVTARFNEVSGRFRPGSFVRVDIETDTREGVVLIPKQAVVEEEGESYVVLIDEDSVARRSAVVLGYQNGTAIEAKSGVLPGDSVVIAGQGRLKNGDKTRVVSNTGGRS